MVNLSEARFAARNELAVEFDGMRFVRIESIVEHYNTRDVCNTHTNILRRDVNRRGRVWTNDPYSSVIWYDARVVSHDGVIHTVNLRDLKLAAEPIDELEEFAADEAL